MENKFFKNISYNLATQAILTIVALFAVPLIIRLNGKEFYAILSILIVTLGYFSFLDFGIGKALGRLISVELKSSGDFLSLIPTIRAVLLFIVITSLVVVIVVWRNANLVLELITSQKEFVIRSEIAATFKILILTLPVLLLASTIKGCLEACGKFKEINIIQTIIGTANFAFPVIFGLFNMSIIYTASSIASLRYVNLGILLFILFKNEKKSNYFGKLSFINFKYLLTYGGWITFMFLIIPAYSLVDRFMMNKFHGLIFLAYIAPVYEIGFKLQIVPSAITSVLFPIISSNIVNKNWGEIEVSVNKSIFYIIFIMGSVNFILLSNSGLLLKYWLGADFASHSDEALKLILIAALLNAMCALIFTYAQADNRPDLIVKYHLIEFPVYVILSGYFIKLYGITGAGMVMLIRMVYTSIAFSLFIYIFSKSNFFRLNYKHKSEFLILMVFLMKYIFVGNKYQIIDFVLFLLFIYKNVMTIKEENYA